MAEGGSAKEVGSSVWSWDRALCGAGSPSLGRIRAQSTARVRADENGSVQSQELSPWPEEDLRLELSL